MEGLVNLILAMNIALVAPSRAQIWTPCSASSMLTSFISCMSFLINNGNPNELLPSGQCCRALKFLTIDGMDCFCLIVTGSVPFSMPINRTLATYLPQVCDAPHVLLRCKPSSAVPSPVASGGLSQLNPSSAMPSYSVSPSFLLIALGFVVLKYC